VSYAKGELKDFVNWYTDPNAADPALAIAPTAVVLHLKDPAGAVTTPAVTQGTGPDAITRAHNLPINGPYYRVRVNLNASGNWIYKWDSTGTGQAAMPDGVFTVEASVF
jgi:hypothetical protein